MKAIIAQSHFPMPEHLRRGCAQKLQFIETNIVFRAILASLLDENWTTPNIRELRFARNHCLVGRTLGEERFKAFRCAKAGLIRNIHGIAAVAQLNGDELGYLLRKVAQLRLMN
jgi:hypothetical protein